MNSDDDNDGFYIYKGRDRGFQRRQLRVTPRRHDNPFDDDHHCMDGTEVEEDDEEEYAADDGGNTGTTSSGVLEVNNTTAIDDEAVRYFVDYGNVDDAILDEADQESFHDDVDDNDNDDDDILDDAFLEDDNDNDDETDEDDASECVDGDDDSQHCHDEEEEEEEADDSNWYFGQQRHYINDKVEITKQCMVGGPISSVLILPVPQGPPHSHRKQYDVWYGQGPYLHHVPHASWIRSATPQPRSPQPYTTSNDLQLLVFPEGGSIHGIREYCHNDVADGAMVAVFGGRKLVFVTLQQSHQQKPQLLRMVMNDCNSMERSGTVDTSEINEAMEQSLDDISDDERLYQQFKIDVSKSHQQTYMEEAVAKHQKQIQELAKTKYHALFDDWIWDCRIVPTTSQEMPSAPSRDIKGDAVGIVDVALKRRNETMIIVGLAHQQIEICDVHMLHRTMTNDDSIDGSSFPVEMSLLRLQLIKNHSIPKCIAYSMNIWIPPSPGGDSKVMIASGTVSNVICIWTLLVSGLRTASPITIPSASLNGHEGVVHAVRFHESGQYIVSTSDDRTVRLWEKINREENHTPPAQWSLKWTAYGHTARGWDVTFCNLSNGMLSSTDDVLDGTVVLSTGEDGTLRIWDARSGHALADLRGHSCQCIWRVATIESNRVGYPINRISGFTITTGNDGTIAFYDIRKAVPFLWWEQLQQRRVKDHGVIPIEDEQHETCLQSTYAIPNDFCVLQRTAENSMDLETTDSTTFVGSPTAKRKQKEMRQAVIGMKFTRQRYLLNHIADSLNHDRGLGLIIASQSGSMWDLDVRTGAWTELQPWNHVRMSSAGSTSDNNQKQLLDGNCMCIHPSLPMVTVGTASGDIYFTKTVPRSHCHDSTDVTDAPTTHYSTVLPAHTYNKSAQIKARDLPSAWHAKSVQSMKWLLPNILVSFHVHSILLWYFPNLEKRLGTSLADYTVEPLCLCRHLKGMPISATLNIGKTKLVVGDTRGNLSLFYFASDRIERGNRYGDDEADPVHDSLRAPISVRRECHRKEHVTDMLWQDYKTVVSVGNDGKICTSIVDANNHLIKLLSIPVGSFTGICKIWKSFNGNRPSFIVGGYYGNNFATVDVTNGYEFFRADTGGRQRSIDVWIDDDMSNERLLPDSVIIATFANRNNGCNEVKLHGRNCELSSIAPSHDTLLSHSRGTLLHGESVFGVHIFPIDKSRQIFGILTGSEDCTARITIYNGNTALASTSLPPQVSSIRAVCSCRYNVSSSVVVIGGKNSVELFLVEDINDATVDDVVIRYLGSGSPMQKLSIDHRINCVRAIVLKDDSDVEDEYEHKENKYQPKLVVVSGDSNGSCYEYIFSKESNSIGTLVYQDERPILCLDIILCYSHYILFLGGTAGDVKIFDVVIYHNDDPGSLDDSGIFYRNDPWLCKRINAHSMGTNSIAARLLTYTDEGSYHRYSEYDFRVISCGDDQAICCTDFSLSGGIKSKFIVKDAALSALKGVQFITNNLVVATGYDQKISVWRCLEKEPLEKVHEGTTDIGDVNCFSACSIGGTRRCSHLLVVGGAGLELLQLRLKIPKWYS